mgnify:CR=1 FL=1
MTHSGCVAFYARVSSQTQVKDATIESQLVQLEARVAHDGEIVADEHRFIDDGYSGAQLVRPALERLRDSAAGGLLDRLYILARPVVAKIRLPSLIAGRVCGPRCGGCFSQSLERGNAGR